MISLIDLGSVHLPDPDLNATEYTGGSGGEGGKGWKSKDGTDKNTDRMVDQELREAGESGQLALITNLSFAGTFCKT